MRLCLESRPDRLARRGFLQPQLQAIWTVVIHGLYSCIIIIPIASVFSLSTQLLLYSARGLHCIVCVRAAVAVGVGLPYVESDKGGLPWLVS